MIFWNLIRNAVYLQDPEEAHERVISILENADAKVFPALARLLSGTPNPFLIKEGPSVFGMKFINRVGLAAGFDKDARALPLLPHLGFGFAEIGTVTPLPQPGNPKPRLFRDVGRNALFNRMGFNNEGAIAVAERLKRHRPVLPELFRVGVNIGKNKDTPLENAAEDYRKAIAPFSGLADYVVINISSPNTPGLRQLQAATALRPIIRAARSELEVWKRVPPLLLKLAPELTADQLRELLTSAAEEGVSGFVLTNTLGGESPRGDGLTGGWSGEPVRERAREALKNARSLTELPVVSVGGILSAEEAGFRIAGGASLIQIYSGWVLKGPGFPSEIAVKTAKFSP